MNLRSVLMVFALGAAPALAQSASPQLDGQVSERWLQQQKEQASAAARLATSRLRHQWVSIQLGDRTLRAFVTYPQAKGRVPVVIVGHEVFGLTDSTRNTADRIAALGYITIAPDFVSGLAPNGRGTSNFPASPQAGQIMTHLPSEYANAIFTAWSDYAVKLPQSNGKLGIVGLSWTGGASFRYAAMNPHPALKVVNVLYDVGPPTIGQGFAKYDKAIPAPPVANISVPIYHFIPTRDTRVVNSAPATKDAMVAAGKRYEQIIVADADHAYMRLGENPADKNPANAAAITATIERLKDILATTLH